MLETVSGIVMNVRKSRSTPNPDTIHVLVDDETGNDDRVFPFHVQQGSYSERDKVVMEIDGNYARLVSPAP